MKKRIGNKLLYLSLGFFGLFLLRFGYGYLYPTGTSPLAVDQASISSTEFEFSKKNYANENLKIERGASNSPYSVDQKYEKIASAFSKTSSFNEDQKKVRELTTKYNALIQFEQSSGLEGRRRLNLAIGVPPEKFDHMVEEMKQIGTLTSIRIDKIDKTNEYKDLKAKRISLEKTRDALLKLKAIDGKIDESINLETRILEIETQIQSMGVKLGEYDQENEFCTVKFGLEEQGYLQSGIPMLKRVKVALEWTIKYYLMLLTTLCIGTLLGWLTILLVEKIKLVSSAIETK